MTTPPASLNVYYTRQPAQIAQEKYASAAWNERYPYITIAALTALAAVGNTFLAALMAPMSLLLLNAAVITLTAKLAMPWITDWFAKSDKFRAQGQKEEQVQDILQELSAMAPQNPQRAVPQTRASLLFFFRCRPAGPPCAPCACTSDLL